MTAVADRPALLTREAAHGTQHRYAIEYRDSDDEGCPVFTWRTWAYSFAHALDRFFESEDAEGWTALRIARVMAERPSSFWTWREA